MPIIQIHLMEGRTEEQKKALMRNVTQTVSDTLGVKPQTVRILLQELRSGHFAVAGEPKYADGHTSASGQDPCGNDHANGHETAAAS